MLLLTCTILYRQLFQEGWDRAGVREQPQGEEDDSTVITSDTGDLVAPAGTAVVPTTEGEQF